MASGVTNGASYRDFSRSTLAIGSPRLCCREDTYRSVRDRSGGVERFDVYAVGLDRARMRSRATAEIILQSRQQFREEKTWERASHSEPILGNG